MATLVRFYAARTTLTCYNRLATSHGNGVVIVTALSYDSHGKTGCFAPRHFSSSSNSDGAVRRTWDSFLSIIRAFTRGFRAILGDVKKMRPIMTKMGDFKVRSSAPDLANVQVTSQELRFAEEVRASAWRCFRARLFCATAFPRDVFVSFRLDHEGVKEDVAVADSLYDSLSRIRGPLDSVSGKAVCWPEEEHLQAMSMSCVARISW